MRFTLSVKVYVFETHVKDAAGPLEEPHSSKIETWVK